MPITITAAIGADDLRAIDIARAKTGATRAAWARTAIERYLACPTPMAPIKCTSRAHISVSLPDSVAQELYAARGRMSTSSFVRAALLAGLHQAGLVRPDVRRAIERNVTIKTKWSTSEAALLDKARGAKNQEGFIREAVLAHLSRIGIFSDEIEASAPTKEGQLFAQFLADWVALGAGEMTPREIARTAETCPEFAITLKPLTCPRGELTEKGIARWLNKNAERAACIEDGTMVKLSATKYAGQMLKCVWLAKEITGAEAEERRRDSDFGVAVGFEKGSDG